MSRPEAPSTTGRFDPLALACALQKQATTLLVDAYLVNRPAASAHVFRVCRGTPPHYHATCDEFLYVLSGQGTFWAGDVAAVAPFAPSDLLFFGRGTVHAPPELLEEPVTFLSIDTPRRDPADIAFVHAGDGTVKTFMARNADG